jgi:Ca-activated chloride channel family protein
MQSSLHRKLSLSLNLLLLLIAPAARAQFLTADDFFHSGAQFYISNNIPLAKQQVKMGCQIYPDDAKLKKLEQLLNQQQQQQQQKQQQDQQKNQQDQQSQSQSGQSQSQADQEKAKEQQAQQAKDQEKPDQSEQQKAAEAAKQGDETNNLASAKGEHVMTPQEAERLLNSQKGNEQFLAQKPRQNSPPPNHPLKDW